MTYDGTTFRPAQGNNAYVFPGIGLGAVACRARTLPDELFLAAARTLAGLVRQSDLDHGALYPPLQRDQEDLARDRRERRRARRTRWAWRAGSGRRNVRRSVEALMYTP